MTTAIDGGPAFKDDDVKERKRPKAEVPAEVLERLDGLFPPDALEEALVGLSPEQITRPGGLITQLAGRVVEAALRAELTEHLGHPHGGEPQGSNVRNGGTPQDAAHRSGAGADRDSARPRREL